MQGNTVRNDRSVERNYLMLIRMGLAEPCCWASREKRVSKDRQREAILLFGARLLPVVSRASGAAGESGGEDPQMASFQVSGAKSYI